MFTNCSFETIYITIRSVLLGCAMFIFASGKERYTKKYILADKRYADINGWLTNGTRG